MWKSQFNTANPFWIPWMQFDDLYHRSWFLREHSMFWLVESLLIGIPAHRGAGRLIHRSPRILTFTFQYCYKSSWRKSSVRDEPEHIHVKPIQPNVGQFLHYYMFVCKKKMHLTQLLTV